MAIPNDYSGTRIPNYIETMSSFSGVDVKALVAVPSTVDNELIYKELGNLQTISYSIFREKGPVRALGFIGEKGKSRGIRTIAGSMVFTVFDRHVFWDVMRRELGDTGKNAISPGNYDDLEYIVADQLPPFDLILHFANEYGHAAEMVLYGLEIQSEGQVMSVQDMITENVMQFTARHIAIMRPGGFKSANNKESVKERTFESIMNSNNTDITNRLISKVNNPFR